MNPRPSASQATRFHRGITPRSNFWGAGIGWKAGASWSACNARSGAAITRHCPHQWGAVMPDPSVVRDRVAFADGRAELDPAIEPGAVEQRRINRSAHQLLEVPAGEVQAATGQHHLANLEALAD